MVAQVIIRFLQEIAMGYVDVSKRVTAEAERVMRKVRQKTGVTFGDMSYEVKGNTCAISVESNFSGYKHGFGDDIADIISKSAVAKVVSVREFEGHFDGQADVYVKDVSIVTFRV